MEAELRRDMEAEGLDLGGMRLSLELELRYGSSPVTQRIECPQLRLRDAAAVQTLYSEFREHLLALSLGIELPESLVRIETFVLHGAVPALTRGTPTVAVAPVASRVPAPQGSRGVIWDATLERRDTPVYAVESLAAGDEICGPAIAEARDTTYVIAPGWRLRILSDGIGEMTRVAADDIRAASIPAPAAGRSGQRRSAHAGSGTREGG
jgi:N-methylhydantoinase A/oxoprolinase/acetone carboxylase beta subunit